MVVSLLNELGVKLNETPLEDLCICISIDRCLQWAFVSGLGSSIPSEGRLDQSQGSNEIELWHFYRSKMVLLISSIPSDTFLMGHLRMSWTEDFDL